MALPPDQDVQAMFVRILFYGLYLATFFHCLRWLVFTDEGWKVRKKISWTLLAVTVIICILSTISRALQLQNTVRLVLSFDREKDPPISPRGYMGSSTVLPWTSVVICTNSNVATLLADAVLIYRCWIVYDKSRKVVAFPIFLWIGGLMLTGLQAYWQIVQSASILNSWQPVNMDLGPGTVLTPFWGSTIILNGYTTFMIVRRIYSVSSRSKASDSVHTLKFTMRVLIESGSLYLVTAIAHFVAWWTPNSFAIAIISDMNIAVMGIAFNLILIRVAQQRVEENHAQVQAHAQNNQFSGIRFSTPVTDSRIISSTTETHWHPSRPTESTETA